MHVIVIELGTHGYFFWGVCRYYYEGEYINLLQIDLGNTQYTKLCANYYYRHGC